MASLAAFNLNQWIEEHRHLLKPPVGNKLVWEDTDFIIMIVGGPNQRKDYHVNPTEEFFFQLQGDMALKVIDDGEFKDIPIAEGGVLLLPPHVPHSPQRFDNTVGLVVERQRPKGHNDQVNFYCDNCQRKVHGVSFYCTNLGTQLKPVLEDFWASDDLRTCDHCSTMIARP